MAFPQPTGALDLWTLLVVYVFGNFWIAVLVLALVMFLIMGWLGKVSPYSCMWYLLFFILAMALGYGYPLITLLITIALLISFYILLRGYIESR